MRIAFSGLLALIVALVACAPSLSPSDYAGDAKARAAQRACIYDDAGAVRPKAEYDACKCKARATDGDFYGCDGGAS